MLTMQTNRVKEGRGLHLDTVGGGPVAHELPHRLPAVGRLFCPVVFGDLPGNRSQHTGKPPRRELACLDRYRYGSPGNIFIYQPNPSFP